MLSIYSNSIYCRHYIHLADIATNIEENWTVQRQERYGFSSIACDQTIEQTLNRDSKTKGGVTGFTLNRAALHRWIAGQAERGSIMSQCKDMAGVNNIPRYSYYVLAKIYRHQIVK